MQTDEEIDAEQDEKIRKKNRKNPNFLASCASCPNLLPNHDKASPNKYLCKRGGAVYWDPNMWGCDFHPDHEMVKNAVTEHVMKVIL